jgi:hypothetical protein
MNTNKRLFFVCCSVLVSISLSAQLKVTHLFVKGFSAFGLGAFLHAGVPVVGPDEIGGGAGQPFILSLLRDIVLPEPIFRRQTVAEIFCILPISNRSIKK